jgi:hypothetical protein
MVSVDMRLLFKYSRDYHRNIFGLIIGWYYNAGFWFAHEGGSVTSMTN